MKRKGSPRRPLAALQFCGLLATLGMAPARTRAETVSAVEDVRHFVGEEQWHLKVMARDHEDRVVRELGMDNGNVVERKTSFYSTSGKKSQETTVHSQLRGKRLLYDEVARWSRSGKLEYSFHETDSVNSSGDQDKGERDTRRSEFGRPLNETTEQWSPDTQGWAKSYEQTFTYYPDGDAKECVTSHPDTNAKTDETWGPKGEHGRDKTTREWDEATRSWK